MMIIYFFSLLGLYSKRNVKKIGIVLIIMGSCYQYISFSQEEREKNKPVDFGSFISILFSFILNMFGVVLFGGPVWILLLQLGCVLFSFGLMKFARNLLSWWDGTTLLLVLSCMICEYVYTDRRRHRNRSFN